MPTLNFQNTEINFTDQGKNNVLVLLHGFTESQNIWNDFAKELISNYRVITIDLPGHGKSGCVGDIHTMELMAEVVKSVLDAQGVKHCAMIGHSMGGYVALAFAENYSSMLQGLGLFHSSALHDTPEGKTNRARAIELIKNNHVGFITAFIPDLFAPENVMRFKNEIESLVNTARQMSVEAILASQFGMMERKDQTPLLVKITCPVLFIAGGKDYRVPYDKVLAQIALPKDAVALLLKDIGHMGYIEAKEKTLHSLKCFVDGCYK